MCRRARYRCDLVDEPGEHFAIVPFPDGDRGLAAILLFHAAGGRTRRHGGPDVALYLNRRLWPFSALKSALTQFWCSLGTCGTFAGIDDESVISPKLLP